MAGGLVAGRERAQERLLDIAHALVEARAARMEATGARRVDRARHIAIQDDRLTFAAELRIRDGNGRTQRLRCNLLLR